MWHSSESQRICFIPLSAVEIRPTDRGNGNDPGAKYVPEINSGNLTSYPAIPVVARVPVDIICKKSCETNPNFVPDWYNVVSDWHYIGNKRFITILHTFYYYICSTRFICWRFSNMAFSNVPFAKLNLAFSKGQGRTFPKRFQPERLLRRANQPHFDWPRKPLL